MLIVLLLYWLIFNYYYCNLSDNCFFEIIYFLFFYFLYKVIVDCLCRKIVRLFLKEMKFYYGNCVDIGFSFVCLRGRICFGLFCCVC